MEQCEITIEYMGSVVLLEQQRSDNRIDTIIIGKGQLKEVAKELERLAEAK